MPESSYVRLVLGTLSAFAAAIPVAVAVANLGGTDDLLIGFAGANAYIAIFFLVEGSGRG